MAGGFQAQLRAQLDRDERERRRKELARLMVRIAEVRGRRRAALAAVSRKCARARAKLKKRVADYRAAERERINQEVERMRTEAAADCARRREQVRAAARTESERRRRELAEERRLQKLLRRAESHRKAELGRASRAERRSESDDEVRRNIPEDMIPVFDRVRRTIKGNAYRSRTETFLEWAEENPDVVVSIQMEIAEREIAKLIAERNREELDEVPF